MEMVLINLLVMAITGISIFSIRELIKLLSRVSEDNKNQMKEIVTSLTRALKAKDLVEYNASIDTNELPEEKEVDEIVDINEIQSDVLIKHLKKEYDYK